MEGFIVVFALFVVLWLYILLPAGMAKRRSRSQLIWVLVGLFGTPILACLLAFVGSGGRRIIAFTELPHVTGFSTGSQPIC